MIFLMPNGPWFVCATCGNHFFSAPNRLPLSAAAVEPFAFDRIYGGWWGPVLRSGAWETVRTSALRYIEHLEGVA
jgi:hypothetical protein